MIGYSTLVLALLLSYLLRKSAQWNLQKTEWIEKVDDKEDDDVSDIAQKVQAVLGSSANLPCDTENMEGEDRVYMVLWFKKNVEKPIYSFDVRGRPFQKALHWSDENFFGPRAYFVTTKKPASLQVDNVQLQDEGIYRCRVDFKNAPTKNLQIELTVIVPPYQILLYDFSGREIEGKIGPLYEGSNLTITCEVRGGKPKPKLLWISSKPENVLEENVRKTVNGNIAISKLEQQNLSRSHANVKYTCVSTNTNLTSPVTKSVRLQLYLRPLYVKIVDKPIHLTANKVYKLTCISAGSEPAANLTWYKNDSIINDSIINDTELRRHSSSVNHDDDKRAEEMDSVSRSINFMPKPEDNGHTIKCLALNPNIDGFLLEDSFKLNVLYSPMVDLRLGSNLKVDNIKEGDDVYFECKTRSNPPEQKIEWYHNGQKINQKAASKVIISRYNLVLQLINRLNSGYYTCAVSNNVGETISKAIELRVKYAPICTNKSPYIIGANLGETVEAQCSVFADPKDITFDWIFNNSVQSFTVPENKYQMINSTTSKITYNIASEKDYGTLACITKNEIGKQIEPCMFRVIAAAHPASPYNCSVGKVTNGSRTEILEVYCLIDISEELPQTYHLEVVDDLKTINNITSFEYPIFHVNLSPHITAGRKTNLQFIVYSSNSKGISDRILLKYNALNNSQQNAEFTMEKDYQSHRENVFLLAFTTVVGVTTIFSGLLLITVLSIRKRRKRNENSIPFIDNRTIKKVDLKAENEQHKYILSYELQINKSQPDILHKVDKAENNEVKTVEVSSRNIDLSYCTDNHFTNVMPESDFQDGSLCKSQLNNNKCKKMNIYQNFRGSSETVLESSIFGPESRV